MNKKPKKPAKKAVAKKAKKKPARKPANKPEKFAYTITDKYFGELKVRKTANAWWADTVKVQELIKAFKMDCTIQEAAMLAGISIDQYEYFKKVHPDFHGILEALRNVPVMIARQSVITGMARDPKIAMKYLERKAPKEFMEKKELIVDKPMLIQDVFTDEDLPEED